MSPPRTTPAALGREPRTTVKHYFATPYTGPNARPGTNPKLCCACQHPRGHPLHLTPPKGP